MYTEKEHKQLFKRFFGDDTTLVKSIFNSSEYLMCNNIFNYKFVDSGKVVRVYDNTNKPYTEALKHVFGKDLRVLKGVDIEDQQYLYFHIPSSYEEMSIICDLNGK